MATIKSPVSNFDGYRCGVFFHKGNAEVNDRYLIEWFRDHGYTIENDTINIPKNSDGSLNLHPDFDNMSMDELRAYAKQINRGVLLTGIKDRAKAAAKLKTYMETQKD